MNDWESGLPASAYRSRGSKWIERHLASDRSFATRAYWRRTVDLLSDVLSVVRLSGAYFYDVEATAPWTVHAAAATNLAPRILPEAEHLISYHILTSGRCVGGLIGEAPVEMLPGDVLVFPHGDEHYMSSAEDVWLRFDRYGASPDPYPATLSLGDGGRPDATFVCGFLGCDRRPFNPVLASLPSRLHTRGLNGEWLDAFTTQVVEESRKERAGAMVVLTRMAELMFIEVLRHYVDHLPAEQTGWLAGLADPVVGGALARLHADPARDWTLEELAREVNASRSRLAERFMKLVGQPPMQYLASWRMQVAAGLLRAGREKVSAVAATVGYDSEAAFSRAFKKATGKAPGAWRGGGRPRAALAGA